MATYTVDRAKHATLAATIVDTINFNGQWGEAQVYNRGMSDIYVQFGGDAPTVQGDDCFVVPAGTRQNLPTYSNGNTVVKLITAGATCQYSVEV